MKKKLITVKQQIINLSLIKCAHYLLEQQNFTENILEHQWLLSKKHLQVITIAFKFEFVLSTINKVLKFFSTALDYMTL